MWRLCAIGVLLIPAIGALAEDAGFRSAVEADWRRQDGIGTARNPSTYAAAIQLMLHRGDALIADLKSTRVDLRGLDAQWEAAWRRWRDYSATSADERQWQALWHDTHWLRRRINFANPLTGVGPILFIKQAPGSFSHQLTQVYGRYARPGGGIFILDRPGESLTPRDLTPRSLPEGSFQTLELSYDARRILFSYCATDPKQKHARFYHIYEMAADGSGLKQLIDGPYDDFSPRYLPDGRIIFISTRRGGYHRCGSPGCPVYTLAAMNADGSGVRLLSYHETQEWDPAVMHDGRIIYTRWDYVDRHAVFGEHLWTTRPDGTSPAAYYGNYTKNPVGLWEPQPVPGSSRIMATAAAHHAMTAGSIVLVDTSKGQDGLAPLTRLTPDTPFPESEYAVSGQWHFPAPDAKPANSAEQQRWPGHCYRTPWPLSESYFLAAYSFDPLVGEPHANAAAMFGLYLVDRFGNKELLHRDERISSLWPIPLRARPTPPTLPSLLNEPATPQGVFVLQDIYASDPPIPPGSVRRLRIVQVLPKSTQGKDNPPVGAAAGSPGKQVLGTVPVEADGSAHFAAPARVPLLFQALDEHGQAVQIMRSATYLQPGENATCIGCHEPRDDSPRSNTRPLALNRDASAIQPGPDGSKPFSYPLLVQGVLDRHCVTCHNAAEPSGNINLGGEPEGHYTASYNALVQRVPFSNDTNLESLSHPGRFGARGSSAMKLLLAGHYDIRLSAEDIERLATWMDTNALFYGTFDHEDQRRQQRGQRIDGPKLE